MLRTYKIIYFTISKWIENRNKSWDIPKIQASVSIGVLSWVNIITFFLPFRKMIFPKGNIYDYIPKLILAIIILSWLLLNYLYLCHSKRYYKFKHEFDKSYETKKSLYDKISLFYILFTIFLFFFTLVFIKV